MMAETKEKIRLIIMTDISTLCADDGEADDTESFVRYLAYCNEFDTEGLIATYTPHCGRACPEYLETLVEKYAAVRGNLCRHAEGYPAAEALRAVIRRGWNGETTPEHLYCGTPGAELIAERLRNPDPRPLWVLAWGGVTDLARALRLLQAQEADAVFRSMLQKLRVYAIGDQYDAEGPWIRAQFPELFYILSEQSFRGMYRQGNSSLVSAGWVRSNILNHQNALAQAYPLYAGGDCYGNGVQGVKEGDTPSLLYLLAENPGDPEQPEHGGWGGRFARKAGTCHYFEVEEPAQSAGCVVSDMDRASEAGAAFAGGSNRGTVQGQTAQSRERDSAAIAAGANDAILRAVYRWRADYQADFARRIGWADAEVLTNSAKT